jgi:hypothetical protein
MNESQSGAESRSCGRWDRRRATDSDPVEFDSFTRVFVGTLLPRLGRLAGTNRSSSSRRRFSLRSGLTTPTSSVASRSCWRLIRRERSNSRGNRQEGGSTHTHVEVVKKADQRTLMSPSCSGRRSVLPKDAASVQHHAAVPRVAHNPFDSPSPGFVITVMQPRAAVPWAVHNPNGDSPSRCIDQANSVSVSGPG